MGLFFWNVLLTAAVLGLFVHVNTVTTYMMQQPSQKENAIVA